MLNVLVAPLDWGLGHTTRCIPLVKQLLQNGCTVYAACKGASQKLLEQEFKNTILFLPLRGYNISYTADKRWLPVKIIQQLPKILFSIRNEQRWLQKAVKQYNIDCIISDNRYGLHHKTVHCIFITHQLQIQAPYNWLEKLLQRLSYNYINRFNECWVPDTQQRQGLAGKLSHPTSLPKIPVHYIGALVRFKNIAAQKKYDWLIILSGPEPQRTLLEQKLLYILPQFNKDVLIARGLPGNDKEIIAPATCIIKNHLATLELNEAIAESEYIISRPGYTTVMEILALQKKFICIPTPGQTEQEYLGKHLMKQQWCYSFQQDEDFTYHLETATAFNFKQPNVETELYKTFINQLCKQLNPASSGNQ